MRLEGERESENVEDRRGMPPQAMIAGGGLGTLVILLIGLFFGVNPQTLMRFLQQAGPPPGAQAGPGGPGQGEGGDLAPGIDDEGKRFVKKVLAETEDVWSEVFGEMGQTYKDPKLVLFSGQVSSACGLAEAAVGPFYCPGDQKVYIDLSFYDDLARKFHAPGDFAQAYVIAHEVGHHVQNLMGTSKKIQARREQANAKEANDLSVRVELQADFLAGVWANHAQRTKGILEEGDIEQAITAAQAIGDDRLQKQGQGYVVPDSFTHGSSAQRVRWFMKGFKSGRVEDGNTFLARSASDL